MMRTDTYKRAFFLFFIFFAYYAAFAQNIKTGVLVVGATPAGIAAAIQSAHSGAKTVLVEASTFESLPLASYESDLRSGIYATFVKRVESAQRYPVTKNQIFTPSFAATIFKAWADTVKNLTVITKTSVKIIRKNGKGWEALLSDKREVKADIIVDASENKYVAGLASVNAGSAGVLPDSVPYATKKYRTSVAIIPAGKYLPSAVPIQALTTETENFIIPGNSLIKPVISTGQAAGAIAAYCSFFKTTTKNLSVRTVQSELITFGSQILRFDDIDQKDSNQVAIQSIALTGILKGKVVSGKFLFMADSTVSSQELVTPVKEYYTRSQIWFPYNNSTRLTVNDVLSLIKCVASRGEELNREVEKAWSKGLKLPGKFDLKKPVTRREFAVLFNTYVKPFTVAVDINGGLKR